MMNILFRKTRIYFIQTIAGILIYFVCIIHPVAAEKWNFSDHYKEGDDFMKITLLGALYIKPDNSVNKLSREISGLAWDEDEQLLYGISDDGYISHIRVNISDGLLVDAEVINSYRLKDVNGNIRKEKDADAEGLTIENSDNGKHGDSLLTVVLDDNTRLQQFDTKGDFIRDITLPDKFNEMVREKGNIEVNSLAGNSHDGYFFITKEALFDDFHYIYNTRNTVDRIKYENPEATNVVGVDLIKPDNLIILDRKYISIIKPVLYCLRSLNLTNSKMIDLACFNNKQGWKIDNFEGVARHRGDNYFIISDDNESILQKTLLIYLRCNECQDVSD